MTTDSAPEAPPPAPPTPRERAEAWALRFRGQANHLAFQFGAPLYLVGSYLHAEDPGDIDIRCLIAREELKQSRRMTRRWNRKDRPPVRIDFQFQEALFNDAGEPILDDRPRIRLDAVPNDILRAGKGEP